MADEIRIRTRFAIHTPRPAEKVLDVAHETLGAFELATNGSMPSDSFVSVSAPCPQPCVVEDPEAVHWHDAEWFSEVYLWTSATNRAHHAEAVNVLGEALTSAGLKHFIRGEPEGTWHLTYDEWRARF